MFVDGWVDHGLIMALSHKNTYKITIKQQQKTSPLGPVCFIPPGLATGSLGFADEVQAHERLAHCASLGWLPSTRHPHGAVNDESWYPLVNLQKTMENHHF